MKNKVISIGVDVGSTNGAIGAIDSDGKILLATKVPVYKTEIKSKRNKSKINKETMKYEKDYRKRTWVNFKTVGDLIAPYLSHKIIYTVEKVSVRPGEGEPSSFCFGNSLGIFQGLYPLIKPIEYYEPLPTVWKKELGVTSDKDTSIKLTEDIFKVNLRDYVKTGKVDDIAEALLLALYGFYMYTKKERE